MSRTYTISHEQYGSVSATFESLSAAAQALGRTGGRQRTEAQTAARRANGRKGGRPRMVIEIAGNPFDAEDSGIDCPCCTDGLIRYRDHRGTGRWICDECGRRWEYRRDPASNTSTLMRGTLVRAHR